MGTNGFDKTAFFMGTVGAEHPAELVRTANHAFSGGGRGVIAPLDLRVTQTNVPSSSLRMAPGAVIIGNTTPGAQSESYVGRAPRESIIGPIGENGSGTRTDLIGVRIKDPEYGGFPSPPTEADAVDWEFIEPYVHSNASPDEVAMAREDRNFLPFPIEWTNILTIPPNTGTFTNEMLTNLRRLAQPAFKQEVFATGFGAENALIGADADLGKVWPDWRPTVRVPWWATRATLQADLSSVGLRDGAAQGLMTACLGTHRAANIGFDEDAPQLGGSRRTYKVTGIFNNITDIAGRVVDVRLEARKLLHAQNPGYLVIVEGTQVTFTLNFYQDIIV